jgi:hypothetical protein
MWARSISTRYLSTPPSPSSISTSVQPSKAIGSSYWEVCRRADEQAGGRRDGDDDDAVEQVVPHVVLREDLDVVVE